MEETIKGTEVIAYKGMEFDMTCRDFKYKIGKTYKTDKVKLCECGFHACLNPRDVLDYYPKNNSRYFKVKLSGEITKCDKSDTKVAATEITILEEITDIFDEVIETTEWWKNNNVLDLLPWSEGFAKIQRGDGLRNFFDKNGNYLSNEWYKYVFDFNEGFAIIQRGDRLWNYIDKKGNYILDKWFYDVYDFHDGVAIVRREDMLYNFIDKKGNILSDEWFNDIRPFYKAFTKVQRTNGDWCKIDKDGKLIKLQ